MHLGAIIIILASRPILVGSVGCTSLSKASILQQVMIIIIIIISLSKGKGNTKGSKPIQDASLM